MQKSVIALKFNEHPLGNFCAKLNIAKLARWNNAMWFTVIS